MKKISPYGLFEKLKSHYGSQHWWPAETKYEIVVGAVLTQNTNWNNVERAINNLKQEELLSPGKILDNSSDKLKKLIRPSGFYNAKASTLRRLTYFIHNNNVNEMPMKELREQLLKIKGVGLETADSILLYAYNRPVFVIDAYTKRLAKRLKISSKEKYNELQEFFQNVLPEDTNLYAEFHALIVEHCKKICKKEPQCNICFMKDDCPKSFSKED
ncbi:MAG: endonuclease III domain-containing protein [Petrotogales bacterium]